MKFFSYVVIAVVLVMVVAGFFIAGSPQEVRLRGFDERRVNDLQTLQSNIINFWTNKAKLPDSLSLLKDDVTGFVPPHDPQTAQSYEYHVKSTLTFSLCATFAMPSIEVARSVPARPKPFPYDGYGNENWQHTAGRVCFDRTIDPDVYRPQPVPVPMTKP